MSAPPDLTQFSLEDFSDAPEEVRAALEKAFFQLNPTLAATSSALEGLTFTENFRAQWLDFRVTVPTASGQAFAQASTTAAQSIPASTFTVVNFGTVTEDTRSAITTGAAWKFTVPTSGRYRISVMVRLASQPAASLVLSIFVNGADTKRLTQRATNSTGDQSLDGSTLLTLTAGQTVDLRVNQSSAGAVSLDINAFNNWVIIEQVTGWETTPASCWPVDLFCDLSARPKGVFVSEVREVPSNDRGTRSPAAWYGFVWDYVPIRGRPHVRVQNLAGLTPGKTYDIRLLVVES